MSLSDQDRKILWTAAIALGNKGAHDLSNEIVELLGRDAMKRDEEREAASGLPAEKLR